MSAKQERAKQERAKEERAKEELDASSETTEPAPPCVAHESLFESYQLTTPILGVPGAPPPDALLQLCLQVGVITAHFVGELKSNRV